jgi:hypothetical protein
MSKPKRKSLSKKTRFEIFKRDCFTCQYCGAHPPEAVLVVDHIVAVAAGGMNDDTNLVTSCENCNQGKSDRSLSVVPQSLASRALEIEEREAQLIGYQEIMQSRRDRIESECWRVIQVWKGQSVETFPRDDFRSVKVFVEKLGFDFVLEAMELAVAAPIPYARTFRYFCAVCWNRIKGVR